ncbi:MAG TPA: hypothetical protein PKV66_00745 [Candidatus Pelethenecus sp.]|nr:hypothetical protein [Candidatus Pelethenecus sp.]
MVLTRIEKKRAKFWKKLGFEYEEILGIFSRLNFLEGFAKGVIPNIEKSLNEAIRICNKQTEDVKTENEQRKKMFEYLTTQETIKEE